MPPDCPRRAVFFAGLPPAPAPQQHGPEQQEELQQEQQQVQNHHQNTERLPDSLQLAGWACNDHRCCAERRLIASCVVEARRRGVAPHKVVTYVRRRLGGGLCIFRFRSDGSPGCSAPCTLCAREILKFDLKVCCLLSNGEVFCGKLTDPGAPSSKITGGQRSWLRWWACCQGRRPDGTHGDSVGGSDADDRGGGGGGGGSRQGSPGRQKGQGQQGQRQGGGGRRSRRSAA